MISLYRYTWIRIIKIGYIIKNPRNCSRGLPDWIRLTACLGSRSLSVVRVGLFCGQPGKFSSSSCQHPKQCPKCLIKLASVTSCFLKPLPLHRVCLLQCWLCCLWACRVRPLFSGLLFPLVLRESEQVIPSSFRWSPKHAGFFLYTPSHWKWAV